MATPENNSSSAGSFPPHIKSVIQGILSGLVLSQGGLAAVTFGTLPLAALDYAAIKNGLYKGKGKAFLLAGINAIVSLGVSHFAAPFSPFAQSAQLRFNQVIAKPVTAANTAEISTEVSALLSSDQQFWLRAGSSSKLYEKQKTVQSVTKQRDSDNLIREQANKLVGFEVNRDTYSVAGQQAQEILAYGRFKIAISPPAQKVIADISKNAAAIGAQVRAEEEEKQRIAAEEAERKRIAAERETRIANCEQAKEDLRSEERHRDDYLNLGGSGNTGWLADMESHSNDKDVEQAAARVEEACKGI